MKKAYIGLCGRSGSGKGYVCSLFADLGIPSVDADKVYSDMTSSPGNSACMNELAAYFGEDIRRADGSLDRQKLASIVFATSSRDKLNALNSITHKYILAEIETIAEKLLENGAAAVLIDAPALFESGFDDKCDYICCVVADEERRIRRICRRDGVSEDQAKKRLASQITDDELIGKCDFVIRNNGDDSVTIADIRKIAEVILPENC